MRSILVVNPKGGCGKTTIATNLASYYAVWGVPTALVDYDPQRSSLDWLEARSEKYEKITGIAGHSTSLHLPEGTQRVIYDVPARSVVEKIVKMMNHSDAVVIPVLPSPIDIRAAAHFISEFISKGHLRQRKKLVGIVANRVKENTVIYHQLEQFLGGIDIPFVTSLRDTQNYVHAARRGVGIFEMGASQVEKDLEQWRPLINWIEGKPVRTR
ncbi:MAG: AAA family ATPase [Gammaproteobacteria bacterium]|nr:AAA family ATPase [Gammaproteobacteria bacterium]